MKILYINIGMHPKNLHALFNYNIYINYCYSTDLDSINLNEYDVVYSPSQPINVNKYPNTKFIFGPHFSVFPESNHMNLIKGNNSVYIQPSEWAKNAWINDPICQNIRFETLPFGVDIEKFKPVKPIYERNKVFIYYKRRHPNELKALYQFLISKNINPKIFNYVTKYPENEYVNYLKESRFGIWLTAHESQGFALEEALSCDVPLLIWNVTSMNQEYNSNYKDIKATTIPYWDNRCGEYFTNFNELPNAFTTFISKLNQYKPREYITENLSFDKCKSKLIEIINKI